MLHVDFISQEKIKGISTPQRFQSLGGYTVRKENKKPSN
jgi:hypothetical protein